MEAVGEGLPRLGPSSPYPTFAIGGPPSRWSPGERLLPPGRDSHELPLSVKSPAARYAQSRFARKDPAP